MNLIGEISLRCDDTNYSDFDKSIYERAMLRASRKVARRYKIIQRIYETTLKISYETETELEDKKTKNIQLPLMSFTSEYGVRVNGYDYTKVKTITPLEYEYVLYRTENTIEFNYSPRSEEDKLELRYVSDINVEDYDIEELQPVIPSQYDEELISLSCIEIAKLGVVKYVETEKEKKYTNILKIYNINEKDLNKNLLTNDNWTVIKVSHAV